MKITVIHGQSHKGITHHLTWAVLDPLVADGAQVREFFLPKDGPGFCIGCNCCFMKGAEHCPGAAEMQPIAQAIDWADVLVVDSPNYVMEMSGGMKNLMDHLAYRWVTHRPSGSMFTKVGLTLCSSAGAPAGHTTRSLAKQLKWMGMTQVYRLPFTSNAMTIADLKPKKQAELEKKAKRAVQRIKRAAAHPRVGLRARACFAIFSKMQSGADAAWNPTDRDWWVTQGWTGSQRPW